MTDREQLVELVNKLFNYTDARNWSRLQSDVFTEVVTFDMSTLGGEAGDKTAVEICETWSRGFAGIDAVNHLSGNHVVTVDGDAAHVFCYATATHYKAAATKGTTREIVGTYDLTCTRTAAGWRLSGFRYTLKYMAGNVDLA